MKRILSFVVFALLLTAPAFAQVGILDVSPELEKKCTSITQAMTQKLQLNEPVYIQLKALNRKRMAKTAELLRSYTNNDSLLHEKLQEVELDYEQQLINFLSPKQLEAYATYRKDASETMFAAAKEKM
ncbi:hypothetical protein DXT99_18245 [Pontibacter diazotrophicus]|uniref:Periplasmic heavy metal sensor n=1 Tax=Pontibacter diazotrophicus TaxID=1400979 RepID=A0A3D8L8M4_9BACT|nr:hypothetical protein [Pontibacter diazotrophicus]RDV13707.1 hypothetical protein DXT99_18245 [Pontibacter diazotrophicus]